MSTRVLIVDDNLALAEDLGEILQDAGYETRVFSRPRDVLASSDLAFDVALLDVRMPELDGVALHRELASRHPESTFILMTAYTEDDRVAQALAAGARAVLPKPVPLEQLLRELPRPSARVLIVDDDRALAEGLSEALQEHGYECTVTGTLAEARSAWESGSYEGAVVDVRLPDGDGTAFAHALAADPRAVAVLITGFDAEAAEKVLQRELGGRGKLLTKPFAPDALLRTLAQLREVSE